LNVVYNQSWINHLPIGYPTKCLFVLKWTSLLHNGTCHWKLWQLQFVDTSNCRAITFFICSLTNTEGKNTSNFVFDRGEQATDEKQRGKQKSFVARSKIFVTSSLEVYSSEQLSDASIFDWWIGGRHQSKTWKCLWEVHHIPHWSHARRVWKVTEFLYNWITL